MLVLDEWVRFGQAEVREERHNQILGDEKCAECSRMMILETKRSLYFVCYYKTSGFYFTVTGKAVSFLKQGGDTETVALA